MLNILILQLFLSHFWADVLKDKDLVNLGFNKKNRIKKNSFVLS
jgi:hypothetical protein